MIRSLTGKWGAVPGSQTRWSQRVGCAMLLLLLLLPVAAGQAAERMRDGELELTVEQGDFLVKICDKYLDDPQDWPIIARLNRLPNPNLIFPGQQLLIPVRFLKGVPVDGIVTFIKGEVLMRAMAGDPWRELQLKDTVRQGNGIRTGNDGNVEITFENGDAFLLRPGAHVEITKARRKGGNYFVYDLLLKAGRAISAVKKSTGKEKRYRITTPSAIAGVRGTKFRVSVDAIEATRCEVLAGEVGVNAQRAEVAVREGEGTLVKKGRKPLPPRQLLPPPAPLDLQELYRVMPLRFRFAAVAGARSYRVLLARDRELKDVVKSQTAPPDRPLDIIGVNDGTYYLSSSSIDQAGIEGLPGAPVAVQVRVNPLPPFLEKPVAGSEHRERQVHFNWLKVEDAVKYHIQLAEDEAFSTIVEDRADITGLQFTSAELDFRTYFFRISSIAADGYEGVWSDTIRFTVIPPPPAPPLEEPAVDEQTIRLRWKNLGDNIRYHVQVAKDKEFSAILIDDVVDQPEMAMPRPEAAGVYYVRTSSIDQEGYEGEFSLPQSFTIEGPMYILILHAIGAIALILISM